ncbi:MAG: SCP2 sterol-binding domain-containing protein [Deltaproteobacteria bacterium]|nr:SCP2 sterol-binding domain-containing protein [Deltaproteobacteria bacterium]MBW2447405.1 SCP2 sterol-binding domain-containing protein [Deltaproteobacteria bacterium]
MAEFPESPISPKEFMEGWLPGAFGDAELPPGSDGVDVKLGVKLEGSDGGEWVFHMNQGDLVVSAESRDDTAFTVVQTVIDWRGALWEGRGGAFGQGAVALFKPGAAQAAGAGGGMGGAAPSPAALEQMRALDGVIKMVVAGGEGGDWSVAFKLGPGAIPDDPTTTVSITAEDADAMAAGTLDPMQAFMAGRIQVAGDMALMMQMQAIQMQAAAQAGS